MKRIGKNLRWGLVSVACLLCGSLIAAGPGSVIWQGLELGMAKQEAIAHLKGKGIEVNEIGPDILTAKDTWMNKNASVTLYLLDGKLGRVALSVEFSSLSKAKTFKSTVVREFTKKHGKPKKEEDAYMWTVGEVVIEVFTECSTPRDCVVQVGYNPK